MPGAVLTLRLPGHVMLNGIAEPNVVVATAVSSRLSGSARVEETTAMLVIVPLAPVFTFTVRVKEKEAPLTMSVVFVQTMFPVPPTDGVAAVHPAGVETETKVVLAGTALVIFTEVALLGPALVTLRL